MNLQGIDIPVQYSDIDEVYLLPMNFGDVLESTSRLHCRITWLFSYSVKALDLLVLMDGGQFNFLIMKNTLF